MVGSPGIAGLMAHVAFWAILGIGAIFGEVSRRALVLFVLLWSVGVFGFERLSPAAAPLVTAYVAILDIALALIVFKGDVRLS